MTPPLDVLVVGAGPTGLALAAQLRTYGASFRIVDRSLDRVHESRALGIQPRTLEALAGFGVTDKLVARGNPATQLRMHLPGRVVQMPLFDIGLADTAYPFLLFLSQAETESVLSEQLAGRGVLVERGTEVVRLERTGSSVACRLRSGDGGEETVDARYVVGCDGAHSTVRDQAGIGFEGRSRRWPRRRRSCGPRPRGRWSRSSRTGPRGCGSVRFGVTVTGVARAGRDRIVDADPSRSASLPRSRPAATELRTRARRFVMSRVQLALRVPDLDASVAFYTKLFGIDLRKSANR